MSDWGATGSDDPKRDERKLKYGFSSAAGCIKAGNDLIMPGGQRDVDDLLRAVGAMEGETDCPLTVADLQACTRRIIHLIMQSLAYEDAEPYGTHDDIK